MSSRAWAALWGTHRPLVGVVHLLPLPGAPCWSGSMPHVIERATSDARALTEAGFDALVVENYSDVPFFAGRVPAETVAALTIAAQAVRASTEVPVGVNVLRNDAAAALGIAVASGASFVRVNVHTGSMWTDQGLLHGDAARTLRLRAALASQVAILADVHVKHATPPEGSTLEGAAADTWHRGLADALIVTGRGTGERTSLDDVGIVRSAVPEAPILVGSGVTEQSVGLVLEAADGAIVGSATMAGGRAGSGIDPARASALVRAARG